MIRQISTGNQGSLRQQNISSILRLIYNNRPISRVELSRLTGLNKATVSSLVTELIENGFLQFVGENKPERAGRREVMIDIDREKASIVSAEVGVGSVGVIVANFAGEIVYRREIEIEKRDSHRQVANKLKRLLKTAVADAGDGITGISLAVPGAVDIDTGTILFAPNLGWRNFDLLSHLKPHFDIPIHIDNEASLAAVGEYFYGAARGAREVVYLSVGIGIGGGVITDGELYRGVGGIAGEFGHMTVDINGKECACGKKGCWETIASESALLRKSGKRDTLMLLKGIQKQDPKALRALAKTAENLAVGIDSLIKIFDPDLVVIGGPIVSLKENLLPMINRELSKRPIFDITHRAETVVGSFGSDAAMMGGVARAVRDILFSPLLAK